MYYLYTFNKITFEPVHIMLSKCLTYSTNKFVYLLLIAMQLLIFLVFNIEDNIYQRVH